MATFDETPAFRIEKACATFDRRAAAEASTEFAADIRGAGRVFEESAVMATLKRLRKQRYFDAALEIAEAVLQSGQRSDAVRIVYAQALIDTGRLAAALAFIQEALPRTARGSHGESELRGLIGRTYKQMFVNGAGERALHDDYLLRAFQTYYDAYAEAPERYWHGINAVALLERARKDGVTMRSVDPFAQRLFEETDALTKSAPDDPWPMATSAEAALALGNDVEAVRRYGLFAGTDPAVVGAFEIYSALRQLIEVWRLDEKSDPGSTLLPMLRAALLERSGGDASFSGGSGVRADFAHIETVMRQESARPQNEKTFGPTMFKTLTWYRNGLERCNPVCRINDANGAGIGTGFLVRGGDFHDSLGDEKLVLTNAHVLSATYPGALRAGDAFATFEALGDQNTYELGEIVFSDSELDATLARATTALPTCVTYPIAKNLPLADAKTRVYVIGHPNGAGLHLSLNDNLLLDLDARVAHYRAPTEGGSSGSPVFNGQWQLVALHHLGDFHMRRLNGNSGTYEANEGVLIQTIVDAAKSRIGA